MKKLTQKRLFILVYLCGSLVYLVYGFIPKKGDVLLVLKTRRGRRSDGRPQRFHAYVVELCRFRYCFDWLKQHESFVVTRNVLFSCSPFILTQFAHLLDQLTMAIRMVMIQSWAHAIGSPAIKALR